MVRTRYLSTVVVVGFLIVAGLAVGISGVGATDAAATQDNETYATDAEACEGNPQMSRTSMTTPQDRITADQPGTVEANFRVDPNVPDECTVVVDVEYSFSESGFQFSGGGDWEQSATDVVATRFDSLNSGEIRSIDADLHTNGAEAGDEVTVSASYEIWYEGDRDNSRQQTTHYTLEVEDLNPVEDEDDNSTAADNGADDGSGLSVPAIVEENLGMLLVFTIATIAVIGLIKREPFVQIFTGGK